MSKDTFRKVYSVLKSETSDLILAIKTKGEELEDLMSKVNNREMSLAKTNLEQAIMWSTKAVILDNEKSKDNKENHDVI